MKNADYQVPNICILAVEKLPMFARCLKHFAPEQGVWGYMMKIACTSPSTEASEHMWFVVQDLDDENVTAELVNQPFEIPETLFAGELIFQAA